MKSKKRLPNVLEALDLYSSRWFRTPFEELAEKCCERGAVSELQFLYALRQVGRLPAFKRKRLEELLAEDKKRREKARDEEE